MTFYNPFGGEVHQYASVASTMDVARDAAKRATPDLIHGSVYRADFQSRGRGRDRNRRWEAIPGENLLCTLVLDSERIAVSAGFVPLATGLAVARSIDGIASVPCTIKWPNDVLVDGRKISGILCESDSRLIFIGVGVNCNQSEFAADLRRPATSIRMLSGSGVDVSEYLQLLLSEMHRALMQSEDRRAGIEEIESRLAYRGQRVHVLRSSSESTRSEPHEACAVAESDEVFLVQGLGADGELILSGPRGEMRLYGGEVDPVPEA